MLADSCSFLSYYSSLQAAQLELERQQKTDSLKKHLEKRPERDELIERMSSCPTLRPLTLGRSPREQFHVHLLTHHESE